MKKLLSVFLAICIFAMNTVVPMAADATVDGVEVGQVIFPDADENYSVTMTAGETRSFYFYSPFPADTNLEFETTDDKILCVHSWEDGKTITVDAYASGWADVIVRSPDGIEVGRLTVNVVEGEDVKPDDGEYPDVPVPDVTEKMIVFSDDYGYETDEITLENGFSGILNYEILANISSRDIAWYSSNENVATIARMGRITIHGDGTTVITAYSPDGILAGTLTVHVGKEDVPEVPGDGEIIYTEMVFYDTDGKTFSEVYLDEGENFYFSYQEAPGKEGEILSWEVSDPSVVEVYPYDGYMYGLNGGSATVSVYIERLKEKVGEFTVYVNESPEGGEIVPGDGEITETPTITFYDADGYEFTELVINNVGDGFQFSYTYYPEIIGGEEWIWYSTDKTVALGYDGAVLATGLGYAQIVVQTKSGMEIGRFDVIVSGDENPGEGEDELPSDVVNIPLTSWDDITLTVGLVYYLDISKLYGKTDDIYWLTDGDNPVSVKDGYIYANSAGDTLLLAYDSKSNYIGSIHVTVEDSETPGEGGDDSFVKPSEIHLDYYNLELSPGNSHSLFAKTMPVGSESCELYWYSDNESVASVEANGPFSTVYANEIGTATITVSTEDGSVFASCVVTVEPVYVSRIELSSKTLELRKNEYGYLSAGVYPYDATNQEILWTSDNEDVATVDEYGNIYATGNGTAIIRAEATDGSGVYDECSVTVTTIYVTSIELSKNELEMREGAEKRLYAYVDPYDAENQEIAWTSDNEDVATVDEYGYVYAVSEGTAIIRAEATDGSGVYAQCVVTVASDKVTGVTLDRTELELMVGDNEYLNATITPSFAENQYVYWESDNEDVATVNYYGKVTAVGEGKATITVTTEDGGYTASCMVTVKVIHATDITLDAEEINLDLYTGKTLNATIYPDNASNKNVVWSSSNTNVATVNSYGYVYGAGEGKAIITASTENGNLVAQCLVNVNKVPVTGVRFEYDEMELNLGDYTYLNPIIEPSNATNKNVTYSFSNPSILWNRWGGYIEGYSIGSTYVTVTTEDGGHTATMKVTVPEVALEGIEFESDVIEFDLGDYDEIYVNYLPEHATNKKVSFVSSDPDIVSVYDGYSGTYGNVEAHKVGTATITATSEDGGYVATCTVVVKPVAVTGIEFNSTGVTLSGVREDRLNYSIRPYNATNQNLTFESSNEDVAVVENGYIIVKGAGDTVITAITEDGGYRATLPVEVLGIMSEGEITLGKDEIHALTFSYHPDYATEDDIIWESMDESVATVDQNGVVTAVGKGTARIVAYYEAYVSGYGDMEVSDYCEVTVDYEETSGKITDTVSWEYDADSTTLYISGTGEIPENWGMTDYGFKVFGDRITDVKIGSGITYIGRETFLYLENLERVYLSDTVTSVSPFAFYFSYSTDPSFVYEVDEASPYLCVEDDVLFSKDMTKLISYPMSKSDREYTVPSTVKEIAPYAFNTNSYRYNSTLGKIVLGENVETIGNGAFYNCSSLSEIVIDKKLTSIGSSAFSGCPYMDVYYYGSESEWNMISKTDSQLYYSNIRFNYVPPLTENGYEYYVKDGKAYIVKYKNEISTKTFTVASTLGGYPVVAIEDMALEHYDYLLDELIIPEGIEEVGAYLTSEFSVKKLTLPSTIRKIGVYAIGMSIEEISVASGNKYFCTVDGILFSKDKTKLIAYPAAKAGSSYTVPKGVKMLSSRAFLYCDNLESIDMGDDVTYIGYSTFEGCQNLKTVTMPAGITNIEYNAFCYADSITDVYYAGNEACWNTIDMQAGNESLTRANIHFGTVDAPKTYIRWGSTDYENNRFFYDVYINDIEVGKTVVVAYYYKNKLVYTANQVYNGEEYLSFERNYDLGTIDCVKAMVWDNLGGILPVCKSAENLIEAD